MESQLQYSFLFQFSLSGHLFSVIDSISAIQIEFWVHYCCHFDEYQCKRHSIHFLYKPTKGIVDTFHRAFHPASQQQMTQLTTPSSLVTPPYPFFSPSYSAFSAGPFPALVPKAQDFALFSIILHPHLISTLFSFP